MDIILSDTPAPIVIGATGVEAICQSVRTIVATTIYSVPLDRGFAQSGTAIDSPSPAVTARLMAEIADAIEKKEPRVKVERVAFVTEGALTQAMQGVLYPKITITIKGDARD